LTLLTIAKSCHGNSGIANKLKADTLGTNLAGRVAAMTVSELGVASEKTSHNPQHPWLTGTAVRGGQAVWRFSLMQAVLSLGSTAEKLAQCLFLIGTTGALVGV